MDSLNEPSPVEKEIPSAVRSSSTGHAKWLVVAGMVSMVGLVLLKSCSRSNPRTEPQPELQSFTPSESVMPELRTQIEPVASPRLEVLVSNLDTARRTSPIMIFNESNTSSESVPSDSPGSGTLNDGPPGPQGFQPSQVSTAHAQSLGDRSTIIAQGKMLDAVLETAIHSDHPGLLRALISNDIYGDTGRIVLLPRGTRLVGQYDSNISQGDSRIYVVWQRAIRPDGVEIALASGGTDSLGRAGVAGKVNRHFFTMFGVATLLSIIGTTTATVGPSDPYRQSVAQGFGDASQTVLGTFSRIQPTITVREGTPMKVFVARDLVFDPTLFAENRIQVIP
jgi:type IV secretory pathway VirB10-like protein